MPELQDSDVLAELMRMVLVRGWNSIDTCTH